MENKLLFPNERKCKKCGKEIFPTSVWAYKENSDYYCSWKCFNHRVDEKPKRKVILPEVGDTIEIKYVSGIPSCTGKVGVVKGYDFMGQLHGTWGNWVVVPGEDIYKIIGKKDEQNSHTPVVKP